MAPFLFRRLLRTSILTVPIWAAVIVAQNYGAKAATTLIWDSNTGLTGAQDGSGTWSAGGTTWWNGSADVATTSDLVTDIAQFGNAGTLASVATIDVGTQSIAGLIFAATTTSGYTLTNTAASTLTIGSSGITMNSGAQVTTVGDPTDLSLALGAAQTWTNNSSGLLTVGGNVTNSTFLLTIAGTGAVTISGGIGSGSGGLTKTGTGTTTLAGANGYTGATTVNAGTLQVGNGTSGSLASTSALALGGGTLSVLGNTTGTTSQTMASLAVNAGASAIVVNANGGGGTTLNVKAITRAVGGTIDFSGTGGTITSTGNTSGILGGYATFGGNTWAVANGASAITGLATFTNDTWAAANNTTVTLASNTAYNNVTTNSLRFNSNAVDTVNLSGTDIITTGGILVTSAVGSGNMSMITGGTLEGKSGQDLVAIVNNTGGLTIGSIIANNSTATGLTVSGPGTLTLTAANTFTGATTVNGTLDLSNSLALQNSTVTVNSTGNLIFDSLVSSHAFTIAALGSGNLSLTDNGGNAVALTLGGNNGSSSSSAAISGSGSLIKTGTGTLTLSGANTYTGGTTVSNGVLSTGSGANTTNSFGTGPITVQNGGTLDFNSSRSLPVLGALTINGAGASGQPGALAAGGGVSYASFGFASITLGSSSTIGAYSDGNGVTISGSVNLAAFTLTLNPNAFNAAIGLPGIISGAGGLIQNGSGSGTYLASVATSTLSGANTYTGATTVTVGTLAAGVATVGGASPTSGAFGVNSTTTVSTGATLDLHDFSETLGSIAGGGTITSSTTGTLTLTVGGDNTSPSFSGVIQNGLATSVSLTKIGAGTQILSGVNTYTGATTVTGGTLQIGNGTAGSVATTSALALGGGTFTVLGTTTGATAQTVASLAVNPGASAIVVNANGGSGTTLNVNAITHSVGGTVDFSGTGATDTTTTTNVGGILGGYATFGGTTWAVAPATSGGAITGLAVGSYTNDTWASGNNTTVTLASNTAYNAVTTNSLQFNTTAANTVTLSGANVITTGGILVTSAVGSGNLSTITGGTLEGASGQDLVVIDNSLGGLAIGSIVANNTTATGLTVSGPGTTTLTANNTYTGVTTVNGGTLFLSNTTTGAYTYTGGNIGINDAGTLQVGPNIANGYIFGGKTFTFDSNGGGAINISGSGSIQIASSATFTTTGGSRDTITGTGTINNNSVTVTFNVARGTDATSDLTVSVNLTNSGTITKTGLGILTLTGNDLQTTTTISAGTLVIGGAGQFGSADVYSGTIANSGTFSYNSTTVQTFSGIVSGTGALIQNGPGTLSLTAANTYTGGTTVAGGVLALTGSGTLGNADPLTMSGGTLDLGSSSRTVGAVSITAAAAGGYAIQNGSLTGTSYAVSNSSGNALVSANLLANGSAGLTKSGAGTLTLFGTNTYTGATNVNAGTVVVSGSIAGNVTVASTAGFFGTLASGVNGTASSIAGNVTVNADNTNAGVGGILAPGGLPANGQTSVLAVNGSVTLGTTGLGVAHLDILLGGTTAGSTYDQVKMASGALSLTNVELDGTLLTSSYTPVQGDTYYIIAGVGSTSGTFTNLTAPTGAGFDGNYQTVTFGGATFAVSFAANFNNGSSSVFDTGAGLNGLGGTNNDVALQLITAIPEPSSLSMLAASFGLALGAQRFRRRKAFPA